MIRGQDIAHDGSKRRVLLGVTGCIAAYKSAELVRRLQDRGYIVKVVMTEHATEFVGPTTFRALTHEKVAVGLFDDPEDPIHHISLAEEADVFLIAPCTANVIAKIACGLADDLLTTTALATRAPLIIAPAMNVNMYEASATRHNAKILKERGVRFVEPDEGYLACGDTGRGRLAEIDSIVEAVAEVLSKTSSRSIYDKRNPAEEDSEGLFDQDLMDLKGRRVMITAGPTQEAIDPVRFISNHSSGKMGYALAGAAARRGAEVSLISGPVNLETPVGVEVVQVQSAQEMYHAASKYFNESDLAIFTAAVCDMRPKTRHDHKLKKGSDDSILASVELEENPDILASLGAMKRDTQVVIGFAAETDNLIEEAKKKLILKNADIIVANEVSGGKVFGSDDNEAYLVEHDEVSELLTVTKETLAGVILNKASQLLASKAN